MSFNTMMDALFGPISMKWCVWYKILAIIAFVTMVIASFATIMNVLRSKIKNKFTTIIFALTTIITVYGLAYFTNRLLYSMCVKK